MPTPLFDFFEVVAEELASTGSRVITRADLRIDEEQSPLLDDLKQTMKAGSTDQAILRATEELGKHFKAKGSKLPFDYEPTTGRFTATDRDFLSFVKDMCSIRSIGRRSHDFECTVARWLGQRATGSIHRVGHPRDRKKKSVQFNQHLRELGFGRPVLVGKDKDGGLDILWFLPMGAVPHRPLVSVQCKNGAFNMDEARKSVGAASDSLAQHAGLQSQVHVPCVLFNDYICSEMLSSKQMHFVPLGLTDLAPLEQRISVELI